MTDLLAADALVVVHGLFIVFVGVGGLLVIKWPRVAILHLPAAGWGALVELMGWICPLTPLEIRLRAMGGAAGYSGGFIQHYLIPLIYPRGLTYTIQLVIGFGVIVVNLGVYWIVWRRLRERRPESR